MQYTRPKGDNLFFGDPLPFSHGGLFHLVILLDEGHHTANGGLGGHRWAHYTSADLQSWTEEDFMLVPGPEGAWDHWGICTGSVFFHDGIYYAFYAARVATGSGWPHLVGEKVGVAFSHDGIHFEKHPSPILEPQPGFQGEHRDPVVYQDHPTGLFHMLVTSRLSPGPLAWREGCLAHYTSKDLREWTPLPPMIEPMFLGNSPECPDYFEWNGWYYLLFSLHGSARYRMSRNPQGPWIQPAVDTFEGPLASVMKTAPWKNNRRIGAAFLGTRDDGKNDGPLRYAGNVLFRELRQFPDGTLGVCFVPEMIPPTTCPLPVACHPVTGQLSVDVSGNITLGAPSQFACASLAGNFDNGRIHFQARLAPQSRGFEIFTWTDARCAGGARLEFNALHRIVSLREALPAPGGLPDVACNSVFIPEGFGDEFEVDIILHEDIMDVCLNGRRCLVDRFPKKGGNHLFVACEQDGLVVSNLQISPLTVTTRNRT